jgi:hypothetical protein
MRMRHGSGRERVLAAKILKTFTTRWVVLCTIVVAAGVATVFAASATTRGSHAELRVSRSY